MASITTQSGGRRMIQFTDADRRRRTIRLGKVSKRSAESVRGHVEHLVGKTLTKHAVPDETSVWVAGLDAAMVDKLAVVGLIPQRNGSALGPFITAYVKSRHDVKPSTATVLGHTKRNLLEHFGADKPLRDITRGDAARWRLSLIEQGLADNTVRRQCGIAKQFFTAAVEDELIPASPFTKLVASVTGNPKKSRFVTRDETSKVIEACPERRMADDRRPEPLRWLQVPV